MTKKECLDLLIAMRKECEIETSYEFLKIVSKFEVPLEELEKSAKEHDLVEYLEVCREICFENAELASLYFKLDPKEAVIFNYANHPQKMLLEWQFKPGELEEILGFDPLTSEQSR